jgi:hypothetical protein
VTTAEERTQDLMADVAIVSRNLNRLEMRVQWRFAMQRAIEWADQFTGQAQALGPSALFAGAYTSENIVRALQGRRDALSRIIDSMGPAEMILGPAGDLPMNPDLEASARREIEGVFIDAAPIMVDHQTAADFWRYIGAQVEAVQKQVGGTIGGASSALFYVVLLAVFVAIVRKV